MIPWEILGRERAPDGAELVLYQRGAEFVIRVGGQELMSSRASNSEEEMARLAIARLGDVRAPRILIGGLGMGFTVRAALNMLPPLAEVVVAEIVPAVIAWNRGPLAHLAGRPLDDSRTRVEPVDVARVMRETSRRFDAILLDVDNGPRGLTRKANQLLYAPSGLENSRRALQPGGLLAIWSAAPDLAFEHRLGQAGYQTTTVTLTSRGRAGGAKHTVYLGQTPKFARPKPVGC